MEFPRRIAEVLAQAPNLDVGGILTQNVVCDGARYHSPRPLLVQPTSMPSGRTVNLCGVCRGNVRIYQLLQEALKGPLPWVVRREFGSQLRMLIEEKAHG